MYYHDIVALALARAYLKGQSKLILFTVDFYYSLQVETQVQWNLHVQVYDNHPWAKINGCSREGYFDQQSKLHYLS